MSITSLVLDEGRQEQTRELLTLLPVLQKRFDEPLVDPEEIASILEERMSGETWGVAPLLELAPAERRTSLFRAAWDKGGEDRARLPHDQPRRQMQEQVSDDFADLLVASLETAVEDSDSRDDLRYYVDMLIESENNRALALRMVETMIEAGVRHISLRFNRAYLLHRNDREDEGLAVALDALGDHLQESRGDPLRDWETDEALQRVYSAYLPERRDDFLTRIDDVEAQVGASPEISNRRLGILEKGASGAAMIDAIRAELEKHGGDKALLQRLERALRDNGRTVEALAALERLLEAETDPRQKDRHRGRLARGWESQRHPARALAVATSGDDETDADAQVDDASDRKIPRATILELRKSVDAGDPSARTVLRRLWRGESPVDEDRIPRYYVGGVAYFGQTGYLPEIWPTDAANEPKERTWSRGGLPEWVTDAPDEEEKDDRRSTFDVLLDHPFGRDELERRIRVMNGLELSRSQRLFEAIADDMAETGGPELAFRETWRKVEDGKAGKADYALMLALLERAPDSLSGDEARGILMDVLKTLDPGDGTSMLRLARNFARLGATDEAKGLYRWCATQSDVAGRVIFFDDSRVRLSASQLVKEVKENLEGEDRVSLIERILRWAEPGEQEEWARHSYDTLVLSTWEQVVDPAEALERCRAVCEEALSATPPRRSVAWPAARMFARAGDVDGAVRALEVAVTRDDEATGSNAMILSGGVYYSVGSFTRVGATQIQQLFPHDVVDWPDAETWLTRAAETLASLAEEDRLAGDAAQAMVVIAHRLRLLDAHDVAAAVLDDARQLSDDEPGHLHWIADAARLVGDDAAADEIERELLDRGELNAERIPEVIGRELEDAGPRAALALGRPILEYCRHPDLIALLARAAEDLGDDAESTRLRALGIEAAEAADNLERRREAAKRS